MNVTEATRLGKRYDGAWALRECTLAIPAGHVAALVGPNGAGKTTLLNLAVGLAEPTAGAVTVLGGRPLRPGLRAGAAPGQRLGWSGSPQGGLNRENVMDKALTGRIEQQVRQAFPEGAIARVRVLQYGDDPEVEPGQTAMRVFFDWPGRSEGGQAGPKTVHQFLIANVAALNVLRDELPLVIGWVEFRPEGQAGAPSPDGLSYRITDRGRPAPARDESPEDRTPVMVRLGAVDLATVDTLITAGVVNSRADGLRWALSRLREDPAYTQLQQQAPKALDASRVMPGTRPELVRARPPSCWRSPPAAVRRQ